MLSHHFTKIYILFQFRKRSNKRTPIGKYCFGMTPLQTFLDAKRLAHEKILR
ncbi:hypothetical protein NEOC65_000023 [Neochlamydia sp. AcF65]|nr:hypothetical protein [Neochlamydia sp. AcF65]NGY94342.1 hypothetical protein [Neochlamydia sp. AcF84]